VVVDSSSPITHGGAVWKDGAEIHLKFIHCPLKGILRPRGVFNVRLLKKINSVETAAPFNVVNHP